MANPNDIQIGKEFRGGTILKLNPRKTRAVILLKTGQQREVPTGLDPQPTDAEANATDAASSAAAAGQESESQAQHPSTAAGGEAKQL